MFTACGDATCALWDTEAAQRLATFQGHSKGVKTLSVMDRGGDVFASGACNRACAAMAGRQQHEALLASLPSAKAASTPQGARPSVPCGSKHTAVRRLPRALQTRPHRRPAVLPLWTHTGSRDSCIMLWDARRQGKRLAGQQATVQAPIWKAEVSRRGRLGGHEQPSKRQPATQGGASDQPPTHINARLQLQLRHRATGCTSTLHTLRTHPFQSTRLQL